jgi:threonine-phosphate decarboxylase
MHKHGGDIYTYGNVLDFSANINPLGTPPAVIEAACEGVKAAANYPDPLCRELIAAIADHEQVKKEQVICGNGAADLIFSLCVALKPKKALLIAPSFYEYEQALRAVNCEIIYHYLKEEDGFHLKENYLEAITDDIDIVFLCNPNNPTGIITEKTFLLSILKQCKEKSIFFVADECFNDFLQEPECYTLKDQLANFDNFLILKAFTKIYAMAGLRLGFGLTGNKELIDKIKLCSQPWSVSIPAQKAGIAALKETEYVKTTLKLIKNERTYLIRTLKEAGFILYDSAANYLFFQGSPSLHTDCLKKQIMIRDCSNYEGLREGFYRIVVKQHDDNRKLIETLKKL